MKVSVIHESNPYFHELRGSEKNVSKMWECNIYVGTG